LLCDISSLQYVTICYNMSLRFMFLDNFIYTFRIRFTRKQFTKTNYANYEILYSCPLSSSLRMSFFTLLSYILHVDVPSIRVRSSSPCRKYNPNDHRPVCRLDASTDRLNKRLFSIIIDFTCANSSTKCNTKCNIYNT